MWLQPGMDWILWAVKEEVVVASGVTTGRGSGWKWRTYWRWKQRDLSGFGLVWGWGGDLFETLWFPRLEGQPQLRNSGVNWHVSALCDHDTSLQPHFSSLCTLHSGQGVRCLVPEAVWGLDLSSAPEWHLARLHMLSASVFRIVGNFLSEDTCVRLYPCRWSTYSILLPLWGQRHRVCPVLRELTVLKRQAICSMREEVNIAEKPESTGYQSAGFYRVCGNLSLRGQWGPTWKQAHWEGG